MNTRKAFLIVAATAGCGIGCLLAADQPLPWEREVSLREAAQSVALTEKLNPTSPLPSGEYFGGGAMSINNLNGEAAMYPALLADEINLDSPQNQKEMMLRTIQALRTAGTTGSTLILLGQADTAGRPGRPPRFDAETLLNSRSGRIHLFPATGKTNEVAFHNFQARGAFLVSACQKTDGVYFVEIGARRSLPCQIMNPWPGKQVVVHEAGKTDATPFEMSTTNGECIVFSATADRKYRIEPKEL